MAAEPQDQSLPLGSANEAVAHWQIFLTSRATLKWLTLPFPSALALRSLQQIPQKPLL